MWTGEKPTLSEQLLYQSGQVRTLGKVDDASSRLDEDEMERRRGITIFSHSAWFSYGGDRYYLLDTPGHTDFFGQTERCLWALDLAVLVVSIPGGNPGTHPHPVAAAAAAEHPHHPLSQ